MSTTHIDGQNALPPLARLIPSSAHILDISAAPHLHPIAKLIEASLGHQVIPFRSSAAKQPAGMFVTGGALYVNVDAPIHPAMIVGHELTHSVRQKAPDIYEALSAAISRCDEQLLDAIEAETAAIAAPLPRDISPDDLREEVVATFVGHVLAAPGGLLRFAAATRYGQQPTRRLLAHAGAFLVESLSSMRRAIGLGPVNEHQASLMRVTKRIRNDVLDAIADFSRRSPESASAPTGDETVKYMFAGRKAVRAEDAPSRADAVNMLVEGSDPDIVRVKTGWFIGTDGNWKFEISDALAFVRGFGKLGETYDDIVSERGACSLGDILLHRDLYQAYPELRSVPVTCSPRGAGTKLSCFLTGSGTSTTLDLDRRLPGDHTGLRAILRGVQHIIQNIEGFAQSVSPATVKAEYANANDSLARLNGEITLLAREINAMEAAGNKDVSNPLKAKREALIEARMALASVAGVPPYERYRRLPGVAEAWDVDARQGLGIAACLKTPPTIMSKNPRIMSPSN